MGLFKRNKKVGLIADVITCNEPEYLIWKWHPDGTLSGEHAREYSIRSGSTVRVRDGEVAVFVYKQKSGEPQEYLVGPCDTKLKTANLPILTGIVSSFMGGDTPFQAEIFYINLAHTIQVKFAVPYFYVSDYRLPEHPIPIAVRGALNFRVNDYKEFIKIHRLTQFNLEDLQNKIKDLVCRYVKNEVAGFSLNNKASVMLIAQKIDEISDVVGGKIKERLLNDFGVSLSGFDVGDIDIDTESQEYYDYLVVTKNITTEFLEGKNKEDIKNYGESLRIQREESQYAMHKQTQTANIGAFQIEKQVEVGIEGARALGKMGENGAGAVNLGATGVGFNPAAMMTSIAVGSVVGKNISNIMDNSLNGFNNTNTTPPPVPKETYSVAKDGKAAGPYDMDKLSEMAMSGELLEETLVWKQGMPNWVKAGDVEELKKIFPPKIIL